MATTTTTLLPQVKALAFDVFGTVVDWRTSVETELRAALRQAIASPRFATLPAALQTHARALTDPDVARLAQAWRDAYSIFTRSFRPATMPWKDIDAHHYDSLVALLEGEWQLGGLWTDAELRAMSLVWHRLAPWPDAAPGLRRLGTRYVTCTLSNGNQALLRDLDAFGQLGFARFASAEDVHAYKPDPAVYYGAAATLGVQPTEVALVAAHLGDLQAARSLGLRTIYVERPGEEAWAPEDAWYREAQEWVDLWVRQDEDGFREVARRLGL